MKTLVWSFVLFTISIVVTAQTTPCPAFYQTAMSQTELVCDGTERNQACYGNNTVNLTPFSDVDDISFSMPGDVADVEDIRVLSLSALNDSTGEWGITMMRLLANLDPSTTDSVTLLLFGDVELESAVEPTTSQIVSTQSIANMRQYPTTSALVVASMGQNVELEAYGRIADNSWLQVRDPLTNISGWIFADLLSVSDVDAIPVVESTRPYFGPMQAFYFRGNNSSDFTDCSGVPADGLYIQTPQGVGRVSIWVNQVTVDFLSNAGGTAYITPPVDDEMTIDILEGTATVSSNDSGYVAVAGSSVTVTMDESEDAPKVNLPEPIRNNMPESDNDPASVLNRDVTPSPASVNEIASANGLNTTQYEEVKEYGVVITASQPQTSSNEGTTTNNTTSSGNGNSTGNTSTTDSGDSTSGNTTSNNTQSSGNNTGSNTGNTTGNTTDTTGNAPPASTEAPGNSGNGNNGNGNGNNGNGNGNNGNGNGNNGNGNGNNGNGNGNNGNGNGNNGNGNGNNGNGNGNSGNCPGNSCNAPGKNKNKGK